MSLDACARLVERGDPDRFLAVMAAPIAARARLLPIYAFNLEVARAPWVSEQPLIAEMRLQFWRDVLADPAPRAHEVASPLRQVISDTGLPTKALERLVEARLWDIGRAPHADAAAFSRYVEDTSGGLTWAAARALGAPPEAEVGLRALGWAAGLANYLRAVPSLTARGRSPLIDPRPQAIKALAEEGLSRLATARMQRGRFGAGAPAALSAWLAGPVLERARRDPTLVPHGGLQPSDFARRGRLLWMAWTGRF